MMTLRLRTKSLGLAILAGLVFTAVLDAQRGRRGARYTGPGTVTEVTWSEDGKSLSYTTQGKRFRIALASMKKTQVVRRRGANRQPASAARSSRRGRRSRGGGGNTGSYIGRPTRGRQYTRVDSPDGRWQAIYRDWNVVLEDKKGDAKVQVTTDGNEVIHYGTASWVYGEELNQTKAMWWTPDSKKLLFYKFDDTGVEAFHLVRGWSSVNTKHYPEFYPKAGAKNPGAELMVYDLASKQTLRIDAGGGTEEYIYGVRATPDNSTILVNWTDRLQHDLKVFAIDLDTGKCRVVVKEHQDTWQTNSPRMRYLKDQQRFLWPTDKTGFTHYELRDLSGRRHHAVTSGAFQTAGIQFVDEEHNLVGFAAYSSSRNPYYQQYHMVGLDGKNARRVTSKEFHHSNYSLSPDKKWLVAQYEETNTPPSTALYSTDGKKVTMLAESDAKSGANLAEMFQFKSDDGKFDIYGILYKPDNFDPKKSYPLINSLYGGPGSNEISASYVSSPRAECRRGYLVVKVNNRGTGSRGKAFLGAAYLRLGDIDIQDHADAIRMLRKRSYIDGKRVGIVGHSYGGYMAAMGIFKHPDVYTAAVDRAGPTDWRNYDTIYTERYMSTPQLNKKGYDTGRAMTYVKDFKGKLLIMHGMVDDNVHPTNAFQLIDALDKAGKPYQSRFWPNGGHGLGRGSSETQWEFFDSALKPGGE
ncbi:MAG: DPP IV N-terminal domain-containing protein [Planctomycetota bacterium]|nr:DPP IV N-terminal domain-containing protein [Planctomycetota bacterium]